MQRRTATFVPLVGGGFSIRSVGDSADAQDDGSAAALVGVASPSKDTSAATAATAAATSSKKQRKPVDMPGSKLGYPMFHSITGNLPVLTPRFHNPIAGSLMVNGRSTKPTDYEYMTGT